jgi:hypothetical protein
MAQHGRHELANVVSTEAQATELVERMLKPMLRRIDLKRPFSTRCCGAPAAHGAQGIARGPLTVKVRKPARSQTLGRAVSFQHDPAITWLTPSGRIDARCAGCHAIRRTRAKRCRA